jgi:RNA polymerase sigma factor CnrH
VGTAHPTLLHGSGRSHSRLIPLSSGQIRVFGALSGQPIKAIASILLLMDDATALRSHGPIADACQPSREVQDVGSVAFDLDALVAAHAGQVARLISRLVDRCEDIEDLVQETFLAALAHRRRFRGDCRPATWLARIAVNKCRSHHRRRRVRRLVPLMGDEEPAWSTASDAGGETGEEIRRAVARLSSKHREVIVLRYFEGYAIDELCEVLGLRRAAVEKRLSRARQRLKEMLAARLDQ